MTDDQRADARKVLDEADREEFQARRTGRIAEQRIRDLSSHPTRFVCLVVAAEYLEVDVRTLAAWLDEGRLKAVPFGKRRKIAVAEIAAYERRRAS